MKDYSLAAFYRPCGHGKTEEIKNGYDKIIGLQCLECMELLYSIGKCDGCEKDNSQLKLVAKSILKSGKTHRYCDEYCKKQHQASARYK